MAATWFIAKRYLQSQRRDRFLSFITFFAVAGIALGTAALIVTLSILDGFEKEIKEKVVGFTSHIQVVGFQNAPLPDYRTSVRRLTGGVRGVRSVVPFAAREGMIRSRAGVDGVFLKGIDPPTAGAFVEHRIVDGSFFGDREVLHPIIIGRTLALKLDAKVGDKLAVFSIPRGATSSPRAMQFVLVGVFESGMAEFDDVYAYATLPDAQTLFQLGDQVTGFDITVDDVGAVDAVAKEVQDALDYPHYVRTVFQLYRNLFSWVELQKKLSPIMLSLIVVVAVINIIGTLLMFVLEKSRAIGILKSLGAAPAMIRRIFLLQGTLIGAVGILLGNGIAFLFCTAQLQGHLITIPSEIYYMNTVPMLLRPENFIFTSVGALLLAMLATFVPARLAAALHPINALRFG